MTVWGVTSGTAYRTEASAGAPGYTGYTIHLDALGDGSYNASLTLVGISSNQAHISYGTVGGVSYMLVS